MAGLIDRLRSTDKLSEEDVAAILTLQISVRNLGANRTIAEEGSNPTQCTLIVEGYCVQSKTTSEGRTQILAIQLPGEMPDLQRIFFRTMDHDLVTLTRCTLGLVSHGAMRDLFRHRPHLAFSFWRAALVEGLSFGNGCST